MCLLSTCALESAINIQITFFQLVTLQNIEAVN